MDASHRKARVAAALNDPQSSCGTTTACLLRRGGSQAGVRFAGGVMSAVLLDTINNAWCRSKCPARWKNSTPWCVQLEAGQMTALQGSAASVELSFRETRRIKVALGIRG